MNINQIETLITNKYIKYIYIFSNIQDLCKLLFMIKRAFGALIASTFSATCFMDGQQPKNSERHAICILYPNNSNVRGIAAFSQ